MSQKQKLAINNPAHPKKDVPVYNGLKSLY